MLAGTLALAGFFLYFVYQQYQKISWSSRAYVINCAVFNHQMVALKIVPGTMCVYLKNGNVVSYITEGPHNGKGIEEVRLLDENGQVKWSRSYYVHHTMKANRAEDKVYFFTSESKVYQGKNVKFDIIVALDLKSGKEIASWGFDVLRQELEREKGGYLRLDKSDTEHMERGITHEVSHFNSINLVPEFYSDEIEIIVNSGRGIELFFTDDLKYAGRYSVDPRWMANSHDAQITEEGNLLLYRNFSDDSSTSFLEIRSFKNNRVLWRYDKSPEGKTFHSSLFGSVQMFNDGSFLYSDMDNGGHFTTVSSGGKKLNEFYYPEIDPRTKLPEQFHSVRRVEYEDLSVDLKELLDKERDKILFSFLLKPVRKLFRIF